MNKIAIIQARLGSKREKKKMLVGDDFVDLGIWIMIPLVLYIFDKTDNIPLRLLASFANIFLSCITVWIAMPIILFGMIWIVVTEF